MAFICRALFTDKFLLWKIFPIRCLRWIFQFAVFECPPGDESYAGGGHERQCFLDTVQQLVAVWSKREFVRSAPLEQQACILLLSMHQVASRISFHFLYLLSLWSRSALFSFYHNWSSLNLSLRCYCSCRAISGEYV